MENSRCILTMKTKNKFNGRNVFTLYPYSWKYPSCWWKNIESFFRGFKYTYQRATKGYCDYDLFSISDWFLEVFPNMLKEFADETYSHPYDMDEKEWGKYLIEMREHFLNACKEYENSSPEARKEFDELYKDFSAAEYFKNPELYNTKERKEKIKEYYKKVKEYDNYKQEELKKGMDMFQKRFWDLWD